MISALLVNDEEQDVRLGHTAIRRTEGGLSRCGE
jgi:hypothetical protein